MIFISISGFSLEANKNQTLSFSLIGAPAGATINATSGFFKWTPSTAGSYTFKVRVTDNDTPPLYDEQQITVTVTDTAASAFAAGNFTEKTASFKVTLYPNPVKDKLIVTSNGSLANAVISITDIYGVVVKVKEQKSVSKNNLKTEIEVSELTPGIYFLNLKTTHGSQILKFIKM